MAFIDPRKLGRRVGLTITETNQARNYRTAADRARAEPLSMKVDSEGHWVDMAALNAGCEGHRVDMAARAREMGCAWEPGRTGEALYEPVG